ncbi:MAG TPA: HD-GYP domain-containing protein [Actinomycetota bacterium]|nr:HD-GYP domain-containing protein [Actinomycetota bacterium]
MKHAERQWSARPRLALALQITIVAVPIAASVATGSAISRLIPMPPGAGAVLWWIGLFSASTVVVYATERIARRALPLVALYRLSLVFPGKAPSRSRVARRSASSKEDIEAEVVRAWREGLDADPQRAAETILTLVTALSTHDRRTRGHSERVRMFADLIAAEMDLGADDRNLLRWAALLHDIGKLRVRTETLNKPDRLDEREWAEIKRHPIDGVRLLAPLDGFFGPWMGAIMDHHEKYDGTGYPNNVAGDEISLGARIVAVADAYDTMTASRPYKKPVSPAEGRRELAACAGTHFDPAVVRAFMNISIRRLRWAIGPVSWITQIPFVSRTMEAVTAKTAGAAVTVGSLGGVAGFGIVAPSDLARPAPKTSLAAEQSAAQPASSAGSPKQPRTPGGQAEPPGRTRKGPDPNPKSDESAKPEGPPGHDEPAELVEPQSSPTPTTTPRPSPSPSPQEKKLLLSSSGPGDVAPSSSLPLVSASPPSQPLYNYDVGRDSLPGLKLERAEAVPTEADPATYQIWHAPGGFQISGSTTMWIWAAMDRFEAAEFASVDATLMHCGTYPSCITIATKNVAGSFWSNDGSWRKLTFDFGTITAAVPADRSIVVHLRVRNVSDDAMMFAYWTATYPATLKTTVRPL